ncbi:MAG: CRTAC1 family protein [bacterium]|nr:CRTAC1 family protein [Planctomycetota bacterium]HIL52087.1 CRTAC1 family protein [Planctomycetota bacterium]
MAHSNASTPCLKPAGFWTLMALGACAAACNEQQPQAPPAGDLEDQAAARGLDYINVSGTSDKTDILAAGGAGVALIDLESDGDLDVVFAQGLSSLQAALDGPGADLWVYRNLGDGHFERSAGPGLSGWWTGLATGDIDGDGDTDLVVAGYGGLEVLIQSETGALESYQSLAGDRPSDGLHPGQPRQAGRIPRWTTSVALFDADGDGILDLFAGGYLELDPVAPITVEISQGALSLPCRWKGHEVYCGPRGLVAQADRLFRGRGAAGFVDESAKRLKNMPLGYTLAVLPSDVDGDGDADLVVANDSTENLLLVNDGTGVFTNHGYEAGIALSADGNPEAGMGLAAGDVNRDGLFDYAVTNFSDEATALYLGSEMGFIDATFTYGLGNASRPLLSWSAHLVDFDGDGWLELFSANGHVFPAADEPLSGTRYGQADTLWRLGPEPRAQIVEPGGANSILAAKLGTRGAAVGDVNGDGRPDIVLARIDGPCALGINSLSPENGRLVVHLAGPRTPRGDKPRTPRDASGARVILVLGEGPREIGLLREVQTSVGYQSASSPALYFGLGSLEGYSSLRVEWPSGARTELPAGAAGRSLWIEEGRGLVREEELAP